MGPQLRAMSPSADLSCSRYNLKRRVASLPPLASEVFAEKVLTSQVSSTEAAAKASFEKSCRPCQKTYYSENAFQNHQGSQKHKINVASVSKRVDAAPEVDVQSIASSTFSLGPAIETDPTMGAPESDSEEEEVLKVTNGMRVARLEEKTRPRQGMAGSSPSSHPTEGADDRSGSAGDKRSVCLFCNYHSPSTSLNVSHMSKIHGMFIPERPYLEDMEGLLAYLHEKIHEFHECLFCGKIKSTTSGVQTHMRDKGHCMIAFDSEAEMIEVGQFYDFRATYSDSEEDDSEEDDEGEERLSASAKLGVRRDQRVSTTVQRDGGRDEAMSDEETIDGEGWETDSSASSLDSAELTAVPLDHSHQYQKLQNHPHHSHHDPRPHHNRDGWHSHAHAHPHAVYHSDYELHLPSGRSAGHRSLARYYRQNLHNHPAPGSVVERRTIADASTLGSDGDSDRHRGRQTISRVNGGSGMVGVTEAKKREIKAVEKRERKREHRERQRYQWGVDKRGNSQKHFRVSLLVLHAFSDTDILTGPSLAMIRAQHSAFLTGTNATSGCYVGRVGPDSSA